MCGVESISVYNSAGPFLFLVTKEQTTWICSSLGKDEFLFRFAITREELEAGEEVATCPSCSLIVKVPYNK
jgi:hypothetical protein